MQLADGFGQKWRDGSVSVSAFAVASAYRKAETVSVTGEH
jgi:hypothetical protein